MYYRYNVIFKKRLDVLSPLQSVNKEEKFCFSGESFNYTGLLYVYYDILGIIGGIQNMSEYNNSPLEWISVFLPELNTYICPKGILRKRFAKEKTFFQRRKDGYIYEMNIKIEEGA